MPARIHNIEIYLLHANPVSLIQHINKKSEKQKTNNTDLKMSRQPVILKIFELVDAVHVVASVKISIFYIKS